MDRWLSAHIHHSQGLDVDRLLTDCLHPLIEGLRREGRIAQYFFIRYGEGGPHVRLRVLPVSATARSTVRAHVSTHFRRCLAALDVRWVRYVPEIERYGGDAGVSIAEQHFEHSSDVVLAFLQSLRDRASQAHLKYVFALELAAMLALSAGFADTRFSIFFDEQLRHIRLPEPNANGWADFLRGNGPTLRRRLQAMMLAHRGRLTLSGALTAAWHQATSRTCAALAELLCAHDDRWPAMNDRLGVKEKYVLVVQSYVHMTLNRLGFWGLAEKSLVAAFRELAAPSALLHSASA